MEYKAGNWRVRGLVWWVGLALGVSGLFAGFQYSTRSYKFKRNFANQFAIMSALELFARAEKRFPTDAEELLNSPYLVVNRDELVNPYTSRPLQVLSREEVGEVRLDTSVDPSFLGNMLFESMVGGGVRLYFFQERTAEGSPPGEVEAALFSISQKVAEKQLWTSSTFMGESQPSPADRVRALLSSADRADKRLFSICQYIGSLMQSVTSYGFDLPRTWTDLQATGVVLPLKNPYTGQPIQDVSREHPTPGDFTYVGIVMSNTPTRFHRGVPLCYNRSGKPVDPDWAMEVDKFLNMEREGKLLDRNKQVIKKLVLIH